jgi:hypothetical protein
MVPDSSASCVLGGYFRVADNSEVFIGASSRSGKNQLVVDARFRNKRSNLHGPSPVLAMSLSSGQNPCGAWKLEVSNRHLA